MVNVVIPMAGLGSRFAQVGYDKPKPFIDVAGLPMIERVLGNLWFEEARFVLIVRQEHYTQETLFFTALSQKFPITYVTIDKVTEGAACTVLTAVWDINRDVPLLIANSDQIVDAAMADFVKDSDNRGLDGSVMTFSADHPKWSYAETDSNDHIIRIREKEVISHHATVGIYYFCSGALFVNAATDMIAHNDRVNHEFYVAPAYNYAIARGKKFGIYGIAKEKMHGIGTPEDLEIYLKILTNPTRT